VRTAEVAHLAGVNPQTLRYYERIGLLDAPPRTPGGYRNYPAGTVDVLPHCPGLVPILLGTFGSLRLTT
jgi:MerR family regulatory protein